MNRRNFIAAAGLAGAAPLMAAGDASRPDGADPALFRTVSFATEGLGFSPLEYAVRLQESVNRAPPVPDNYSLGGAIEALEQQFARLLGKPAAMFVPSGTLANLIAVRKLAGNDRRVLVQAESHLYNDSGDGAQVLAGLNLVPLAEGETGFTLDTLQRWVQRSERGRVATPVGVISIESPVRRRDHAMVDFAELARISAWARQQGIRLHLDGARLFNLPLHSGRRLDEVCGLFDTVYVSLWKHFNGTAGAILAGEASFIEGLFHTRRMFGGALPQAWPQVALVGDYAATYLDDYAAAWRAADALIERLHADGRFRARKLVDGTSRFFLTAPGADAATLVQRTSAGGVLLPGLPPGASEFALQVNPTLLRRPPEAIAEVLLGALV